MRGKRRKEGEGSKKNDVRAEREIMKEMWKKVRLFILYGPSRRIIKVFCCFIIILVYTRVFLEREFKGTIVLENDNTCKEFFMLGDVLE